MVRDILPYYFSYFDLATDWRGPPSHGLRILRPNLGKAFRPCCVTLVGTG